MRGQAAAALGSRSVRFLNDTPKHALSIEREVRRGGGRGEGHHAGCSIHKLRPVFCGNSGVVQSRVVYFSLSERGSIPRIAFSDPQSLG